MTNQPKTWVLIVTFFLSQAYSPVEWLFHTAWSYFSAFLVILSTSSNQFFNRIIFLARLTARNLNQRRVDSFQFEDHTNIHTWYTTDWNNMAHHVNSISNWDACFVESFFWTECINNSLTCDSQVAISLECTASRWKTSICWCMSHSEMDACATLGLALEDVVLLNISTWHQFCTFQYMMVFDYCPSRLLTLERGINFVHQIEINTEIVQFAVALLNCVTLASTWISHTHLSLILQLA